MIMRATLPALAAIFWSFASNAETSNDSTAASDYELDEVVVTATRRAESALTTPYSVSVRDMHELQRVRQVRTIPDALRELPGIYVQKTAHGQGSPFIRGFTGQRTLFLIDGIRLNNSIFRDGPNQYWNTVDPLSAHRLEVVRGPASVLYGSDAIGGTVNALTRAVVGNDASPSGARIYARASSAERSSVVRPEYHFSGDRLGAMVALSHKDFGDLEGGRDLGRQPMTGYDELDTDLRLEYALDEGDKLVFALQTVNQDDAWRVHKTVFGRSWEGTTTGDEQQRSLDQDRTLAYLQYRASDLTPWLQSLTVSLSQHWQEEMRVRIRADGRRDNQGTDVGTSGLFVLLESGSAIGSWTTGAEYYRDAVDSWSRNYNADGSLSGVGIQGPVADDATYTSAAFFLQNQLPVGEKSELVVGARYNHMRANARSVQHPQSGERVSIANDWQSLTGSLRFNRRLGDGRTTLFGGVSQGFRAPNLSDLTRYDSARSNEIETPVANLDPENFLNWELGTKILRERSQAQLSVFYTEIDDMIIRTPTGVLIDGDNEVTKRNSGKGYVRGVEGQLSIGLSDSFTAFGNFTWLDGEVDTYPTSDPQLQREPLSRMMPVTVNAGLRWSPPDAGRWLELHAMHAERADELSSRDQSDTDRIPPGGTPGYMVLSLRSGMQFASGISLSLALENLLDEDYRVHGSGVNEPGRNIVATLIWEPR